MILENINRLCAENGITLSALEKALGFSHSAIAKWGTCSPRVDSLIKVADYFNVTLDELARESASLQEDTDGKRKRHEV